MKKFLICVLVLAAFVGMVSAQQVGVGPMLSINMTSLSEPADASASVMTFGAFVPVVLNDTMEVDPFATVTLTSDEDGIDLAAGYKRTDFLLGCGAYWKLASAGPIAVKVGPNLYIGFQGEPDYDTVPDYDTYSKINIGVALPVNLDIQLIEHLYARLAFDVASVNMFMSHVETATSETKYTEFTFKTTGSTVMFGLYYMF